MDAPAEDDIRHALRQWLAAPLADLAAELAAVGGLSAADQGQLFQAVFDGLVDTVRRKVVRLLILELNVARITGRLTAGDPAARWAEFVAEVARPSFWAGLDGHYPGLRSRLATVVANRIASGLSMAHRYARDRPALAWLLGSAPSELISVTTDAGDSHRGGQTVAILTTDAGKVVYKPRPLLADRALNTLLATLLADIPEATRIRVPSVLVRQDYGWARFADHRYCADDTELKCYYQGIGHWLAVMRLVSGVDLHAENLIACGPVPVLIDCETLFTPRRPPPPSGRGLAVDRATELITGSVLRTGLLPNRGLALAGRGIDSSGAGSLPGQQPATWTLAVVGTGTDQARIDYQLAMPPRAANQPASVPVLRQYWGQVLSGFDEFTGRLIELDRQDRLQVLLAAFADCPVRVVLRSTQAYSELERMLWHPVSLHDEPAALERATELLAAQAKTAPGAPGEPSVIAAEAADMLAGDVPVFTTTPGSGLLTGPRGTLLGQPENLVQAAVQSWRVADLAAERRVIQASLVSAYLNDDAAEAAPDPPLPRPAPADDLDRRRRALAAGFMRKVADEAIWGPDGTVTWIGPDLTTAGWLVSPLGPDLYSGMPGAAILAAAYQHEAEHGRADPIEGIAELRDAAVQTMRASEHQRQSQQQERETPDGQARPGPPGSYVGIASQIWAWLLLDHLGAADQEGPVLASALARMLPRSIQACQERDLLTGTAGSIVPLLWLAARCHDDRWLSLAVQVGRQLVETTTANHSGACWTTPSCPAGLGGYAHGVTGIGWALTKLARGVADPAGKFSATAEAAFAFEESLYDPRQAGWRDLRTTGTCSTGWCHGAAGIGLAAGDLLASTGDPRHRDVLARASASVASPAAGTGRNHALCHGHSGRWELLNASIQHGVAPGDLDHSALDARLLSALEQHGPASDVPEEQFPSSLLPGTGGIAYQLLRMHQESDLPSLLILDQPSSNA